jgi:hypothetical protein
VFLISAGEFVAWKLLLIAVCTVLLLLLARSLSSSERVDASAIRDYEPPAGIEPGFSHEQRFRGEEAPKAKDLGPLLVTQFNFSQFDAVPGPPDPQSFADELMVDIYDPNTEHRWQTSFVVATPSGIRKLMDQERWAFFYANEIFIVQTYDLKLIQEAVYGRINEIRKQVGAEQDSPLAG